MSLAQTVRDHRTALCLNQHIPKVYRKLMIDYLNRYHSEYVLKGGRGSVKSSIAALMCVLAVVNGWGNALCIRRRKNTLRDSCYADIQVMIDRLGISHEFNAKLSPMEFYHYPTGLTIYFRGLDDPTKIKSIRPKKGNFAILWIEEANEDGITRSKIRNVQQSVGRGKGGRLTTILSYNPDESKENWANKEFEDNTDPDLFILHTDFTMVPQDWLGELFLKNAYKLKDHDYEAYANEYLGKIVSGKATVFKKVYDLTPDMDYPLDYLYRGVDFGFTEDPTVYEVFAYNAREHTLYQHYEFYGYGVMLEDLAYEIKKENKYDNPVYCDNQEPRSIATLNDFGVCGAIGCTKGQDSIRHGIDWFLSLNAIYLRPGTLAHKEYSGYQKKKDPRTGEYLKKLPDKDNHSIDTGRYACQELILNY